MAQMSQLISLQKLGDRMVQALDCNKRLDQIQKVRIVEGFRLKAKRYLSPRICQVHYGRTARSECGETYCRHYFAERARRVAPADIKQERHTRSNRGPFGKRWDRRWRQWCKIRCGMCTIAFRRAQGS